MTPGSRTASRRESPLLDLAMWPDDAFKRFDTRRRELETLGLSRAAASAKALAAEKPGRRKRDP